MQQEALWRQVARWGGQVRVLPNMGALMDLQGDQISLAPFSNFLGIDYARKVLYLVPGYHIGEVLHELGHIFASRKPPKHSEEVQFLGWEFALARKLDLVEPWLESMHNYGTGDATVYLEFGDLGPDDQTDYLEWATSLARAQNLLRGDKPLSCR